MIVTEALSINCLTLLKGGYNISNNQIIDELKLGIRTHIILRNYFVWCKDIYKNTEIVMSYNKKGSSWQLFVKKHPLGLYIAYV